MRDIALTAAIFALLPVCFARPWIGVLAWYWFGLMNPHLLTWGFARGLPFAMLIALATLTGALFARDRKSVPWNRELVLVLVLLGYFTFTTFFAWAPQAAWAYLEQLSKILLMTFVATVFIHGKQRVRALMLVIGLSIAFYGIKGAVVTVTTGGANKVQGPEAALIGGNTFLGLALNMVIPVLVSLARDERTKGVRAFLNFSAACCVISSVFTYSRGAVLGLAIVLPLLFFKNPRKAWGTMVFLLVAGLVTIAVAPEALWKRTETIETYQQDRSAMQRIRSWGVAWNIAKDRPITGAGFNFEYFPDSARWFSYVEPGMEEYGPSTHAAHSVYFQVLGQHGFVALGLYLLLLAFTLLSLTRIRKKGLKSGDTMWIATYAEGLRIGVLAWAISGAFLNAAYFDLYFIFVALTAILSRELASASQIHVTTTSESRSAFLPSGGALAERRRA